MHQKLTGFTSLKKTSLLVAGMAFALLLASCGAMKDDMSKAEHMAMKGEKQLESLFKEHGVKPTDAPYWLGADQYKGGDLDVKMTWGANGSAKFMWKGEEKTYAFYSFSGDQVIFDSPALDSQLVVVRSDDPKKVDLVLVDFDGNVVSEADKAMGVGSATRMAQTVYPKFLKGEYTDGDEGKYIFEKGMITTPSGEFLYKGTNRSMGAGVIELYFDDTNLNTFYSLIYNHDMTGVDFATHIYQNGVWTTTKSQMLQ